MNFILTRTDFDPDGIFGQLRSEDGESLYYSLEHAYDSQNGIGSYAPKVPAGTYLCIKGRHQLEHSPAPFTAFELQNVPGHTNILIHVGNYNDDSEGCILLGMDIAPTGDGSTHMLKSSNAAFNQFMDLQKDVDQFTLTIRDSQ